MHAWQASVHVWLEIVRACVRGKQLSVRAWHAVERACTGASATWEAVAARETEPRGMLARGPCLAGNPPGVGLDCERGKRVQVCIYSRAWQAIMRGYYAWVCAYVRA